MLSHFDDFENYSVFKPNTRHEKVLAQVFDQVITRAQALRPCGSRRFKPDLGHRGVKPQTRRSHQVVASRGRLRPACNGGGVQGTAVTN
jgi:hypothetical protein